MRINQNIAAINAYRNLTLSHQRMTRSLERLSSGLRINRAADDPSGLVRSEALRAQIGGLRVASRNAQDAISLVQTAEGAMAEAHTVLQRMRDLTVQSGNLGTNDRAALAANQHELTQLRQELDRINRDTRFGTVNVFRDLAGAGAGTAGGAAAPLQLGSAVATQPGQAETIVEGSPLTLHVTGAPPMDGVGSLTLTLSGGLLDPPVTAHAAVGHNLQDLAQILNNRIVELGLQDDYAAVWSADGGGRIVITGPNADQATSPFTLDLVRAGSTNPDDDGPVVLAQAMVGGAADSPQGDGVATALTLTVPAEGFEVPEGYEGQITFTLGAGGLAEAVTFSVDVGADAEAIRDAAQEAGATVSFSGNVVTFLGQETATPLSLTASTASAGGAVFQVGANPGQRVSVPIRPVDAQALELMDLDIGPGTSPERIDAALRAIDAAIGSVSTNRAELGAFQNRMESTIRSLSVTIENLSAAESRIRDADMAAEMMEFTRSQILVQVGTAMLAQANLLPQTVLSLLRF